MKKIIISLITIVILSGCVPNYLYQIAEIESSKLETVDNYKVFENDTIQIIYSFWTQDGIMAFRIYNKTEKDIYVNWEKSSFIVNSQKFNYWEDKTSVTTTNVYASKNINGYYNNFNLGKTVGTGVSSSVVSKEEKITFIPPKSYIIKSTYILNPDTHLPLSDKAIKHFLIINGKEMRDDANPLSYNNQYYFTEEFNEDNSPEKIRNYLTYSFDENFTTSHKINNSFYIKKIVEFEERVKDTCWNETGYTFYKKIDVKYQHK